MLNFTHRMIAITEKNSDLEFYQRQKNDHDAKCREICEESDLISWMIDKVPNLVPNSERAEEGVRSFFPGSKGA
jgi:hypothetical protein